MGYALRDHRHYTYADYRMWPEDVRCELVDGAAFLMAPAPSFDHQALAFEGCRQFGNALEGHACRAIEQRHSPTLSNTTFMTDAEI